MGNSPAKVGLRGSETGFLGCLVSGLRHYGDRRFANPAGRQNYSANYSPSIGELLEFAQTQKSKGLELTFL